MLAHPFFSIIIALQNEESSLEITLKSIAEQEGVTFEVIIVDASLYDQCIYIAQTFSFVTKISSMTHYHRYKMYNRGLKLAAGSYIIFLSPGDIFLSQFALRSLYDLIEKTKFPEVVLGSGILYDLQDGRRKVVGPLSLEKLKNGHLPTDFCASTFQRHKLIEMGGFVPSWKVRGGYELFCRLQKLANVRFITTTRVLTDHKFSPPTIEKYVGYNLETPWIILRYFGIGRVFFYLLTHNYFLILRYWLKNVRFSEK